MSETVLVVSIFPFPGLDVPLYILYGIMLQHAPLFQPPVWQSPITFIDNDRSCGTHDESTVAVKLSVNGPVDSVSFGPAGINEPKDKDTPLYKLYSLFLNNDEKKILSDRYDTPGLRYGDIKKELLEKIHEHFSPYKKRREYLFNNLDEVYDILNQGRKKANVVASEYINKTRKAMGIAY